jgi:hypothetical protein
MAFDVVLTSEANEITVGRRAVMPEWSFSSTHTLDLLETAGWLHAASNTPPRCPRPSEGRACPRAAPARLLPAAGPNSRARPAASSQQARDGGAAVQAVCGPHPRRALPGETFHNPEESPHSTYQHSRQGYEDVYLMDVRLVSGASRPARTTRRHCVPLRARTRHARRAGARFGRPPCKAAWALSKVDDFES